MCYYARTDYECHDWKWGNMMLRCPRQHRIGETCGAKLVHSESVTRGGQFCKICDEIQIKKRRYIKTLDNIQRWAREPDKFSASLEKARREARELSEKIKELHMRRPSVQSSFITRTTTPTLNTLPSMTTAITRQGHIPVNSNLTRRQEPGSIRGQKGPTTTRMTLSSGPTYYTTSSPQMYVPRNMTTSRR